MKRSRQEFRRAVEGLLLRTISKEPPAPLYQKIVLAVLALGALIGLVGVLFFR